MTSTAEKAQSGNPEALRQLVCENYAQVYRFCARRIGEQAAADITQEVFITMHQSLRRFQAKSSFRTWLLGIATNHCRNYSRKSKTTWLALENWHEPTTQFESDVINTEFVSQALAKLSEEHREVIVLHELDGLTYAEIAEITGLPEGTVKSRLHHAFQALRRQGDPR